MEAVKKRSWVHKRDDTLQSTATTYQIGKHTYMLLNNQIWAPCCSVLWEGKLDLCKTSPQAQVVCWWDDYLTLPTRQLHQLDFKLESYWVILMALCLIILISQMNYVRHMQYSTSITWNRDYIEWLRRPTLTATFTADDIVQWAQSTNPAVNPLSKDRRLADFKFQIAWSAIYALC